MQKKTPLAYIAFCMLLVLLSGCATTKKEKIESITLQSNQVLIKKGKKFHIVSHSDEAEVELPKGTLFHIRRKGISWHTLAGVLSPSDDPAIEYRIGYIDINGFRYEPVLQYH